MLAEWIFECGVCIFLAGESARSSIGGVDGGLWLCEFCKHGEKNSFNYIYCVRCSDMNRIGSNQ